LPYVRLSHAPGTYRGQRTLGERKRERERKREKRRKTPLTNKGLLFVHIDLFPAHAPVPAAAAF